jgi:hypothetical protein
MTAKDDMYIAKKLILSLPLREVVWVRSAYDAGICRPPSPCGRGSGGGGNNLQATPHDNIPDSLSILNYIVIPKT